MMTHIAIGRDAEKFHGQDVGTPKAVRRTDRKRHMLKRSCHVGRAPKIDGHEASDLVASVALKPPVMCLLASKRPHILRVQFSGERPIGVHPLGILGIIGSAASPHWSGPLLDLNAPSWQQAGSDDLLDLAAERLGYIVPIFDHRYMVQKDEAVFGK